MTSIPDSPRARLIIAAGAIVGLIFIIIGAALLTSSGIAAGSKLSVVAAENPWGNIAAQIGGRRVHVTSILNDPNADPHLYESDAKDAEAVAGASIIIRNGLGYDDFIDKLMAASGQPGVRVVTAQAFAPPGPDPNPHLWYSPTVVPQMASAIEQALAAVDPGHTQIYMHNLLTFTRSLEPLDATIVQIKDNYAGTPVAYTERVPGYLLQEAGLTVVTPPGYAASIEDGTEPSPQDFATMQQLITSHAIRVLLYNVQTTSATTAQLKSLAQSNHIPVVGVSETMPPGDTYQSWQLAQVRALQSALESGAQ